MFKVKYRDTCESVREHLLQLEDKKKCLDEQRDKHKR